MRLLHAVDHLIARRATREVIGIRQQRAFARLFFQRTREDVVVLNTRNDLLRRQAFRNGDGMLHHLPVNDGVDHVAQTGVFLKQIFAGFESGTRIHRQYTADEGPAVGGNHAGAQEDVTDVRHAGARRNVDDLVLGQWPLRFDGLLAVEERTTNQQHRDDQEGEDRVADHHQRTARPSRVLRRLRYLFRLKRRARAAGRNGWSLAHTAT